MDEAIEKAISMNEEEQYQRMEKMSKAVNSYTVKDWANEQISSLKEYKST